ncbi:hypothetical protein K438DRAFT_1928256 [Mycena galopus ATCC 62051]|nr:hypothetical protein K438DRAFT_1928256 [Mycena galopus ATCC 62051]
MLDRLPPEICAHIFDLACRDTGQTGRALSLVSRYIHQTSELARYISVAIVGRTQLLAFARFLERAPTQLKTHYLFIDGHESSAVMDKFLKRAYARQDLAHLNYQALTLSDKWESVRVPAAKLQEAKDACVRETAKVNSYLDTWGAEGASAVESILRAVSPTLRILDISLNEFDAKMMLHPISLPRLTDLTTRCGSPLHTTNGGFPLHPINGNIPVLEPTDSLRYLHVANALEVVDADAGGLGMMERFFENGISYFAPSLTHLRLSQLTQDKVVITHLDSALGLGPLSYPKITQLPSTIEQILLKPAVAPPPGGCDCCDGSGGYYDMLKHARQLRDKDPRVLLLQADPTFAAGDVYFQEWLEKVDGGAYRWDTNSIDMASSLDIPSGASDSEWDEEWESE